MPTVARPDTEIHYEVSGSGPAIILGHSFLCSGEMWDPQLEPLSASHTVLNVDARGHGRSGPAPTGSDLQAMLGDMLAVLDDAGIDRAIWAGLSMGGMVAMLAALQAPERVRALVLLDTDAGPEVAVVKSQHRLLVAAAKVFGVRPALPRVRQLMFGRTTLRTKKDLVRDYTRRFRNVRVPSIVALAPAIYDRPDLLPRLPSIDVPTLVVVGSEDLALPPSRSRRLAGSIRGAELVEIPEAGHLSTLEQPEAVNAAVLDFLQRLPED